jgi:cbb3-type cytochrome oxidase subunit 1
MKTVLQSRHNLRLHHLILTISSLPYWSKTGRLLSWQITLGVLVSVALIMPSTRAIANQIETVYAKYREKEGKESNLTSPSLLVLHNRELAAVVKDRSTVSITHYAVMLRSEVHSCAVENSHLHPWSSQTR